MVIFVLLLSTKFFKINFSECEIKGGIVKKGEVHLFYNVKRLKKFDERMLTAIHWDGKNLLCAFASPPSVYLLKDTLIKLKEYKEKGYITGILTNKGKTYILMSGTGRVHLLRFGKFYETGAKYLWGALPYKSGIIAFSGVPAKLFKIEKKLDTIASFSENNIVLLKKCKDFYLLGTSGKGFLYKLNKKFKIIGNMGQYDEEVVAVFPYKNGFLIFSNSSDSGSIYYYDGKKNLLFNFAGAIKCAWNMGDTIIYGVSNKLYIFLGDTFFWTKLEGEILQISGDYIATIMPSAVYKILKEVKNCTLISPVLNAGRYAEWGSVLVEAEGEVELWTRSGEKEKPDASWEKWKKVINGKIKSKPSQYLQLKAILKGSKIKSIKIAYLPENQKPKIKDLKAEFEESKLKITWEAEDPDTDSISYTIKIMPLFAKKWITLKEDYKEEEIEVDKKAFPDGKYKLKLIAKDILTNPEDRAKEDEKVIEFTIDNTPPVLKIIGNKLIAKDSLSLIKDCEYTEDGMKWRKLSPLDKIFDDRKEEFLLPQKFLSVRVTDSEGNVRYYRRP